MGGGLYNARHYTIVHVYATALHLVAFPGHVLIEKKSKTLARDGRSCALTCSNCDRPLPKAAVDWRGCVSHIRHSVERYRAVVNHVPAIVVLQGYQLRQLVQAERKLTGKPVELKATTELEEEEAATTSGSGQKLMRFPRRRRGFLRSPLAHAFFLLTRPCLRPALAAARPGLLHRPNDSAIAALELVVVQAHALTCTAPLSSALRPRVSQTSARADVAPILPYPSQAHSLMAVRITFLSNIST